MQGKLLELVEKVETLEILGVRDFLLQTDSPIETLSLRWEDIDWEMNRMATKEQFREKRGTDLFQTKRYSSHRWLLNLQKTNEGTSKKSECKLTAENPSRRWGRAPRNAQHLFVHSFTKLNLTNVYATNAEPKQLLIKGQRT